MAATVSVPASKELKSHNESLHWTAKYLLFLYAVLPRFAQSVAAIKNSSNFGSSDFRVRCLIPYI